MTKDVSNTIEGENVLETGEHKTSYGDFYKGLISDQDNQKAADMAKKLGYEHGESVRYKLTILPKE